MSGILVLGERCGDRLSSISRELIAAAGELSAQGAGPIALGLVEAAREADASTSARPREPHAMETAVAELIEQRRPALVLAGHTKETLGFAPALAARGGHGFACDVTGLAWDERGARAECPAAGAQDASAAAGAIAELDFPGRQTVVLLLRPGAFAVAASAPAIEQLQLQLDPGAARTELLGRGERTSEEPELSDASVLLAIGRGALAGTESALTMARAQRLAAQLGATLSVTGALVEAGLAPGARKVGVSGKRVAPRVYIALGISGAPQHLAGITAAQTVIAVNSDPQARIFEVADHGAVADLFEVVSELERLLARND